MAPHCNMSARPATTTLAPQVSSASDAARQELNPLPGQTQGQFKGTLHHSQARRQFLLLRWPMLKSSGCQYSCTICVSSHGLTA